LIGHNSNGGNELEICGQVKTKEVIVEDGWCDYVFDKDYELGSLEKEAEFIGTNGHLSNFQSEEEMAGEIQLKDVTVKQQKTIEEIMLHVIQLNERLKTVEAENEELKKLISK